MLFFIIVGARKLAILYCILTLIFLCIFLSTFFFENIAILVPSIFIVFVIYIFNVSIKSETRNDAVKKLKRDKITLIAILIVAQIAMIYGYFFNK